MRISNLFTAELVPIAIIYFALFFDFFLLEGYVIVNPSISKAHDWDKGHLTSTMAICKFTMMAMCPLIAYSSSKFAGHHILVFGLVCLALSSLGLAFSHSYAMFAVSKVLHGLSSPSMMLSGMAILTHLSEETTRGKYASYGYSGIAHGLLLAPFVTGICLTNIGQFWTYMLIAGLISVNTVCAIVYFYKINLSKLWGSKSSPSVPEEEVCSVVSFQSIKGEDIMSLFRIMMSNPKMITAVSSCFLVGLSIGANESTLPLILSDYEEEYNMSELHGQLIWTAGSVAYTIFAVVSGFAADRVSPFKLVIGGMVGFIITFALMNVICSSLGGVITFITITGGLTSFLDVAAYPLIASVVDTADIPNAYIIGYSIEYCLEQGAYAIGQYAGEPLYEMAGTLTPVAIFVATIDGFLLLFGLFVCFVYPANRFVRTRADSSEKIAKNNADESTVSIVGEEDTSPKTIHEQL
jgi:MFS family permease